MECAWGQKDSCPRAFVCAGILLCLNGIDVHRLLLFRQGIRPAFPHRSTSSTTCAVRVLGLKRAMSIAVTSLLASPGLTLQRPSSRHAGARAERTPSRDTDGNHLLRGGTLR